MADTTVQRTSERLYLDDLHLGRRFTSGTHALDEKQITAFAREFDPQPFHTDHEAAKASVFHGLSARTASTVGSAVTSAIGAKSFSS